MNKEQTESLTDRLADKTLSLGCLVKIGLNTEIITYPNVNSDNTQSELKDIVEVHNSGCDVDKADITKILGHPVRLGDVLEKIPFIGTKEDTINVCAFWEKCGLSKSLQEIIKTSGWEDIVPEDKVCHACGQYHGVMASRGSQRMCVTCYKKGEREVRYKQQLKDPSARALIEELNKLFPEK